jgi:nudix-type nucleoside diphosphatase (YffH/AdpP family)
MHRIIQEKDVFNGSLQIKEGLIETETKQGKKESYSRERVCRPDAAAIFIFNEESQKVILTKQFRYAIAGRVESYLLEVVAGKVDPGELPHETALRESEEESGYRINPGNLHLLASCFASPGYTSEKYFLFYASVTNADKQTSGGGLAEENESIETVEITYPEFTDLLNQGKLEDAKTLLAALLLTTHKIFIKARTR